LTRVDRILDHIEGRSTIRHHAAKFAVKIGVLRRQPSNGPGNDPVFVGPVAPSAGQDLYPANVEAGMHPVSVELQFVQPVGAVRCLLNQFRKLRFDP
jgi:hypothetical protein